MKIVALLFGLFLGVATVSGGLWALGRDLASTPASIDKFGRMVSMQDPAAIAGLGYENQRQSLLDCANVLTNLRLRLTGKLLAGDDALAVQNCLALADYVVTDTPTNSHAWYIGALAASVCADWAGMNRRLELSQKTGRTEQWLGELRVSLAEANYIRLDETTKATNDRDLLMLVTSVSGTRAIAFRYVNSPDFRNRITTIVEGIGAEEQRRFIRNIRSLANARSAT